MAVVKSETTSSAVDPKIIKCWDDHINAHNAVDINAMAATYTDDCHIYYYNVATGENREFNGIEGKMAFAVEHLNSLQMKNGKPTTDMDIKPFFNGNTLFNQWNIKSDNYSYADGADTFIFGGPDMLITHHYQWYFGTQLVERFETPAKCLEAFQTFITLNDVTGVVNTFSDDCVVSFFNTSTNTRIEANGLDEVDKLYTAFLKLVGGRTITVAEGSVNNNLTHGDTAFYAYAVDDAGIKKANDVYTFSGSGENKIKKLWACYEGPDFDVDLQLAPKDLKDLTRRLLHFNINVTDLEKSKNFYKSLGFVEVPGFGGIDKSTDMSQIYFGKPEETDLEFVHMKIGADPKGVETRIDIVQWKGPAPHGVSKKDPTSLGIARFSLLTDEIFKAYDLLKDAGVTFVVPENNGPLQFGGKDSSIYLLPFYDPDGNMLQFLQGL
uniref:VOC domain-containing protein n=1 Tax=Chaetoceros debilis TaxID=122233 RepID=A0A7S3PWP6_9STRA|mmetsp:Transcript_27276/g.41800  ORF Transcript_27276/g.41800 Transcript_27276/m.41800 type:complete len:438 (+) Transcript_27276:122-1435(+)|eukprot:CAMPEP_0194113268 /NCGR_PEP_ID=MMETSP0150-20130528/15939_1 /TAXON_ID=122233 /ORGANISM="Chaetoceros debilis, Strain MM31A-1" /LENGTH=437 /DNA_ID=CAMNT_0038803153 /DNA_START=28 /DNA_END=1341 /DNA_ORIENTATION=+